jgi:hypothetical protein
MRWRRSRECRGSALGTLAWRAAPAKNGGGLGLVPESRLPIGEMRYG